MKKAQPPRKLGLSRETLRQLHAPELRQAAGQGWSDDSICPTVNDTNCHCSEHTGP